MAGHNHAPNDPPTMHDVDKVGAMIGVYVVIMGLMAATILLSVSGLGAIALPVQMGIATVQALILAWYWMHMRRGDQVVTLSAATALFFIFIFYALTFGDIFTRWRGGI